MGVHALLRNDEHGDTLHISELAVNKPKPVTCKNTRTSLSKPVDNAGQVMDPIPTMLSLNDHMTLWLITGLATLSPEVSVPELQDHLSRLELVISAVILSIIPLLICQMVVCTSWFLRHWW